MAVVELLLGSAQRGTRIERTVGGKTASISLDATVSEGFAAPSRVTQHPVENAVDITDHVILAPKTLSISGKISETPFTVDGQTAGVASTVAAQIGTSLTNSFGGLAATIAATKTLAGVIKPVPNTAQEVNFLKTLSKSDPLRSTTRLRDWIFELLNIRDTKIPVTIVTGLQKYDNYILTSFTVNRNKETGGSIDVTLEFTEFVLANSQTVTIAIPKIKSAIAPSNQGRKTAEPVEGETGKKSSFLIQLARKAGSLASGGN